MLLWVIRTRMIDKRDNMSQFSNRLIVRKSLTALGALTIIVAFLIDFIGFGQPGSFGRGQFLLVAIGTSLLLAGFLGRKVFDLYRGTAIILLNTLVLLACVELISIVLARARFFPFDENNAWQGYKHTDYYAGKEWKDTLFLESKLVEQYRYKPYVIWRHEPFEGQTINVNHNGIRRSSREVCAPDNTKMFTFGGSTMWGWGSPDWGTIPAFLEEEYERSTGEEVCIMNYAEDAFV